MLERKEICPDDFLLILLYTFHKEGREKVSYPELHDVIRSTINEFDIDFDFSENFNYSPEVLSTLGKLKKNRLIRKIKHMHNAFLPKTFFKLTWNGRKMAKEIIDRPKKSQIKKLRTEVNSASEKERWYLAERPY